MVLVFEEDKRKHLVAGYTITLLIYLFTFDLGTSIFFGVLAGVVKECLDFADYGTFDKRDVFFTTYGSILAGLLLVVI